MPTPKPLPALDAATIEALRDYPNLQNLYVWFRLTESDPRCRDCDALAETREGFCVPCHERREAEAREFWAEAAREDWRD
jgi:hypothetical protein